MTENLLPKKLRWSKCRTITDIRHHHEVSDSVRSIFGPDVLTCPLPLDGVDVTIWLITLILMVTLLVVLMMPWSVKIMNSGKEH